MRDLNEIVVRNARRFIATAIASALADGEMLTQHMIAGRMAAIMGMKQDSVRKQLGRMLPKGSGKPTAEWTANYIQGLALAVGVDPGELVKPTPDERKSTEATRAGVLFAGLNNRFSNAQARRMVRITHRALDNPDLGQLIERVAERLLDATTRAEALESAIDLIRDSDAWDGKRVNLRGKKPSGRVVQKKT